MRLHDLISVAPFPAVVSGRDIAALRQNPASIETDDFLSGYLGFDAPSQHALHTTLSSLSQNRNGGAFWLSGVFGSGKSHLLGVLALLGEGAGDASGRHRHEVFARSHPECAAFLGFEARLTLHISLDEFDAGKFGLEEIFWRELEREWARRGLEAWKYERSGAHIEDFAALENALRERGLGGLVVCFDELSLFLAARSHGPLQGDAAWLQFLGTHTRRAPLWVFCALQKTIDDISGLERYSLSQIRDRFTLLPLSLANVGALVQKRLIRVQNQAQLAEICAQTFQRLQNQLPRLDFGPEDWRATFPFHPATLRALEAVTGRFFSRTRSAALFCVRSIDLSADATQRIAPDAIWDYFLPELEAHPDLRPLLTVFRAWNENLEHLFDPKDRENGVRVLKWVLLCKIAGQSVTPVQVANALDFDLELSGDGAAEYARFLLERVFSRGAYLAVERGDLPIFARYTVDLGRRVGEMARRAVAAALETLAPNDARIGAHALSCCRTSALPLADLAAPRSFVTFWNHAPRALSVEVWDGAGEKNLANRAAQTREIGASDEAVLAIWPPFAAPNADFDAVFRAVPENARRALWIWKPRPPTRDEWDLAREGAAAQLSQSDIALLDNRRGRALLEHLQKEAPARDAQIAAVALRLLLEGEILIGGGVVLEAGELARGEGFGALLEAIGDFGWPQIFPDFAPSAPRARLLTPSNADSLCLEILRRPASEPFFAASLERLARHIGEPLGVAKSGAGRWKIAPGKAEINAQIRDFVGEETTYAALEAQLAKSSFGLKSEQVAIALCALLRSGEIAAFDAKNQELSPASIGLPLRRALHFLRPGRLLSAPDWARIAVLTRELCALTPNSPDFAEAGRVAGALLEWRENAAAEGDLARARAAQLRRALGQTPESWPQFEAASQALGAILEAIPPRGAAFEVLSRAANFDLQSHRANLAAFRRFAAALAEKTAPLLSLAALLNHPELVAPPALNQSRQSLAARLGAGENALFDADLLAEGALWSQNYAQEYAAWHAAQNEAARWNSWRRLAQSDTARALERLAGLQNRGFGGDFRVQIEAELGKRCARESAIAGGEAACSSCGLRLGERIIVRDAGEIEAALAQEIADLQLALAETGPREFLTRHAAPFLEWDGQISTLLPLLSGANLRVLDEALAPRRRVARSGAALLEALRSGGTRAEIESVFSQWLDGGDNLGPNDEVEIEP